MIGLTFRLILLGSVILLLVSCGKQRVSISSMPQEYTQIVDSTSAKNIPSTNELSLQSSSEKINNTTSDLIEIALDITNPIIFLDGDSICTVADMDSTGNFPEPLYIRLVETLKSNRYSTRTSEEIIMKVDKSLPYRIMHKVSLTLVFCGFGNVNLQIMESSEKE